MPTMTHNSHPAPFLSAVVCTRNRKANVVHTARAVLAQDYPALELLVMDQSDDDATADALAELRAQDSRLRYFHLDLPGKPRALNRAWAEARGRYLLLTDDDCEPDPQWAQAMVEAFQADPRIGCVFGDVSAGPHDPEVGTVYANLIQTSHSLARVGEFWRMPGMRDFGLGANMAVRADVLALLGGWDPCIGPGAKFASGDDHDLTMRALLTGFAVYFCAEARVVHYGFRTWEQASRDLERMAFGQGAAMAKYLRCGVIYPGPLRVLRHNTWLCLGRIARWRRPFGLAFTRHWLRGLLAGSRHPIDRRARSFRDVSRAESQAYGERFAQVALRAQQPSDAEARAYSRVGD
ncbi:MAG TPA: glycosyltransferase family 2 protein [Chthonomonadaceae bacterium]|nr:glycosyltransferase family 2 protein [Chthonomonadaceae bacterium]